VFIGNVPVGTKPRDVKKLCSDACGYDATAAETGRNHIKCPVESVRFRSVAVAGTGMQQGSTLQQMKKVRQRCLSPSGVPCLYAFSHACGWRLRLLVQTCAILNKFDDGRDSANAYVVFIDEDSAKAVLKLDGTVWNGKHLRVDTAIPSEPASYKRTVFLGSLPFDVNDEEIWTLFASKMEGGDTNIASVRLVRDKVTNVGKVRDITASCRNAYA